VLALPRFAGRGVHPRALNNVMNLRREPLTPTLSP
jgi:hypothetical protein